MDEPEKEATMRLNKVVGWDGASRQVDFINVTSLMVCSHIYFFKAPHSPNLKLQVQQAVQSKT